MHHATETTGPISLDALTQAVLTYIKYPGYLPPNPPFWPDMAHAGQPYTQQ